MRDKLIIAGSRSLNPTIAQLSRLITEPPSLVICGCADGVDKAGYAWARHCSVPVEFFPAWPAQREWALGCALTSEKVHPCPSTRDRSAGYIRNEAMSKAATSAVLLWTGESPGTKLMLDICRRLGLPYKVQVCLSIGDTVRPLTGRGGPWVVQSLGAQAALWGPDGEVAIFESGEFMAVEKLRKVTDVGR